MRGSVEWVNGSISFKKGFKTFSKSIIEEIEKHWAVEARFSLTGELTKEAGKKGTDWESKMFEGIIIQSLVVTNSGRINGREFVVEMGEKHRNGGF